MGERAIPSLQLKRGSTVDISTFFGFQSLASDNLDKKYSVLLDIPVGKDNNGMKRFGSIRYS
jgi:hypothetical protein